MQSDGSSGALSSVIHGDIALSISTIQYNVHVKLANISINYIARQKSGYTLFGSDTTTVEISLLTQ